MNGEAAKPTGQPIAALSYLLGFVTGIIFLYLEPYDKDEYIRFHARQSIAFSVAWFAANVILSVAAAVLRPLGPVINGLEDLVNLGFFIVWLLLMYKAYTGEKYRLPVLSDWVDEMGL
ncbi:MAG: DUF4870 domain-containing protein [Candidatus Binataceae bacterium]